MSKKYSQLAAILRQIRKKGTPLRGVSGGEELLRHAEQTRPPLMRKTVPQERLQRVALEARQTPYARRQYAEVESARHAGWADPSSNTDWQGHDALSDPSELEWEKKRRIMALLKKLHAMHYGS